MADPIDIEVKDSVDGSVEKKLAAIAREARSGHQALEDLKVALKGINTSAIADIQRASASNTNALAKETAAQAKLMVARDKSAITDAKAALEKQRLATEAARTAAAEANAARASSQSEAAALRLAQAQQRAAQAKSQDEKEAAALAATLGRLKSSVDPLNAALDQQVSQLRQVNALHAQGALSDAEHARYQQLLQAEIQQTNAALAAQAAAQAKGIGSTKGMTQATLNLSRQFADIGVTAAMGMNPLMILIQQGPQIADAFQMAGTQGLSATQVLKGMFGTIGRGVVLVAPLAIAIGALAAGFGLFHRQLSKGYPKDITDGMNLTEEQLDRVKSKTVTFGDTFVATFVVIGKRIMDSPIGDALRWIGDTASDVMDFVGTVFVAGSAIMVGVMKGGLKTILENWRVFPQAFGDMVISGVNVAIKAIEGLLNTSAEGLNNLIRTMNASPLMLIKLPEIGQVQLNQLKANYAGAGAALGVELATNVIAETQAARKDMETFASDVSAEALRRTRARALKEAGKPNKGSKGKSAGETAEEKRAKALSEINDELDDQKLLMGLVGDKLAIEARMIGIINGLQRKGITLTDDEAISIRNKVVELQDLSNVQRELERIYEDVTGAQKTYDLGLRAAKQLLDGNSISAQQYAEQVAKIGYEYRMATDPMAAFNDEMKNEGDLLGKFGIQLAAATRLQALSNDLRSKGKTLTETETAALTAQLEQRERESMINSELGAIYEANQGAIDGLTARTVALGMAHQQGMIGAEQYRIGLNNIAMEAANVAIRHNEMASAGQLALASLQSYMSDYQGMLPGLTSSFGNFFTTVADGFADSIARSIVYAEDFGSAMRDVAAGALTELISSLIKLGIQWLITQAIGNSMGTAAAGLSMAQGAAVAAAWAPAAAAVSLATFGANAVPAGAAMTGTYALATMLSSIQGFKDGGMIRGPGGPRGDKIPTMLSDGEYVVNARATRDNRALLEAMNSGASFPVAYRAEGGMVSAAPPSNYRPAAASAPSGNGGGLGISIDMRGSQFGNNNPDELEERFMRVVATELAPQLLQTARTQANEDMTQRFNRPRI